MRDAFVAAFPYESLLQSNPAPRGGFLPRMITTTVQRMLPCISPGYKGSIRGRLGHGAGEGRGKEGCRGCRCDASLNDNDDD